MKDQVSQILILQEKIKVNDDDISGDDISITTSNHFKTITAFLQIEKQKTNKQQTKKYIIS